MDELDRNLLEAWARVRERVRADRAELWRRQQRTRRGRTLSRPVRPWCVAVRASDSRFGGLEGVTLHTVRAAAQVAHPLVLSGGAMRALCRPVRLAWPGVPLDVAAARLGRHREAVRHWLRAGVFQVRYEKRQQWGRHYGQRVPVVWSPRLLNSGASRGESPHAVWGVLWQSLHERIPAGYEAALEREPRVRPYRGERRFRGWSWRCPGRGAGCGRVCQTLYAPLPMDTIPRLLGVEAARGEVGALACERCWGVRGFSLADYRGWNDFVGHISGGLLYGREVRRPTWVRYGRRPARAAQAARAGERG